MPMGLFPSILSARTPRQPAPEQVQHRRGQRASLLARAAVVWLLLGCGLAVAWL
jgi:hypothetical protein